MYPESQQPIKRLYLRDLHTPCSLANSMVSEKSRLGLRDSILSHGSAALNVCKQGPVTIDFTSFANNTYAGANFSGSAVPLSFPLGFGRRAYFGGAQSP